MMVVVAYDVETISAKGAKRLHKVAKICESYGIRVQNSVFELMVDAGQLSIIKEKLSKIIDEKTDSIRFYRLGNNFENRIEIMGKKPIVNQYDPMIL